MAPFGVGAPPILEPILVSSLVGIGNGHWGYLRGLGCSLGHGQIGGEAFEGPRRSILRPSRA